MRKLRSDAPRLTATVRSAQQLRPHLEFIKA
jgi:hypothetical protein